MGLLQDKIHKKAEKAKIPLAVHFDLTFRCNLHCIHCYLPESDRYPASGYKLELKTRNRAELNREEIFNVLDQLAQCGTLFLNFSGGEIFIRRDILDIIEYARKKKFSVSLMTTGTIRFNEKVVDRLASIGIQAVDISLYSTEPEIHDAVTRTSGSFHKTIKAIEMLKEREIKLRLKCPLMKVNVRDFKNVVALAESHGTDWILDPNITERRNGDKEPTYLRIDEGELRQFYFYMLQRSNDGKKERPNGCPPDRCETPLNEAPCSASHSSCYISPYGDVQPCIEIPILCGNLRDRSFKEIWENSEEILKVRAIKRKDLKTCPECPIPEYCHRCVGQALLEHGNLLAPSEVFCRNKKIMNQVQKEVRVQMHTERSKQRKGYEKPAYEAEEVLEKMSLVCKESNPNCKAADPCSTAAQFALT